MIEFLPNQISVKKKIQFKRHSVWKKVCYNIIFTDKRRWNLLESNHLHAIRFHNDKTFHTYLYLQNISQDIDPYQVYM